MPLIGICNEFWRQHDLQQAPGQPEHCHHMAHEVWTWDGMGLLVQFCALPTIAIPTINESTIQERKCRLCQASHRERHCAKHGSCPAHGCAGWWSQLAKQASHPAIVRLFVDEAV